MMEEVGSRSMVWDVVIPLPIAKRSGPAVFLGEKCNKVMTNR